MPGYDCKFVHPLEERYKCPVCHLAMRNCVQTEEGHRFCEDCLELLLQQSNPVVPIYNEPMSKDIQIFPDRAPRRDILNLEVYCNFDGCPWIGKLKELDAHIEGCEYGEVQCNMCGQHVQKKSLAPHQNIDCPFKGNETLGPDNAVSVLEEILEAKTHTRFIGLKLKLPNHVVDGIHMQYSDSRDHLYYVIKEYLEQVDPTPTWRAIADALRSPPVNLPRLAKRIEDKYCSPVPAQPDQGMQQRQKESVVELSPTPNSTPTTDAVTHVLETVDDPLAIALHLKVPYAVLEGIKRSHSTREAQCQAAVEYWRKTVHSPSWDSLAGVLYFMEEEKALNEVKPHLRSIKDPTLTIRNITKVMKSVTYRQFPDLDAPLSKRRDIEQRYTNDAERMEARIREYKSSHPSPSWFQIMSQLQAIGAIAAAEAASDYVKASQTARRIIEAALRDGFILRRDNKFLIVGPGGSGKSTLMARLLGLPVDRLRCSTKLAIHPIRTISVSRISIRGKVWERVDLKRLSEMFADASLNPTLIEVVEGDDDQSVTDDHQSDVSPISSRSAPTKLSPSHEAEGHTTTKAEASTALPSSFKEDICRLIDKSHGYRNLMESNWIHLVDSGGQPQFHEVASIFVQNLSSYIAVLKLSEPLSHHGAVQFFVDGKPTNKPYASPYSNGGVIRCILRAVQSKASKRKGKKVLKLAFVATHRDEDCSAEPLDVKNKKIHRMLVELLPEEVRKSVISRGGSLKTVIFPLNGKNPDDDDEAMLEELRVALMDDPVAEAKQLPLKFYGLEIALLKLMEKLCRQVLSRQECLEVAVAIHFDEESFDVALQFLSDLNIVFYLKDELPNVVFCSSQVILDKLSEIVVSSLRLREDPEMKYKARDGKWRRFRDQGIITADILKAKEFDTHYIASLFSPHEFIKVLEKLLVVSRIGKDEYFMPSVLLPSQRPRMVHPSQQTIPSFAFYFEKGGPQVGVFCSKVSFVIRDCGWELLREDGEVVEVSRNCITFKVPGKNCPGMLSLIDELSNYVEVRLDMPQTYPLLQEKMVYIRDTLSLAFDEASKVHDYTSDQPEHAFMCPEQSEKCSVEPHPATVDESQTLVICTIKPSSVYLPLTALHKMWLPSRTPSKSADEVSRSTSEPQAPESISLDSPPQLQELRTLSGTGKRVKIRDKAAFMWKDLAVQLNFQRGSIATIQKDSDGCEDAFDELMNRWLDGAARQPVAWKTLLSALEDIELNVLAHDIRQALGFEM